MGSNVIIMLPPPPPTTIWTYSPEIEKELDYITAQIKVSETMHRMLMDSIFNLRELGYPQHQIDFIKEQFKIPIRKRELPARSPQITQYMDMIKKHVVKVFVENLQTSTEEAEKMADKIISGVKNKYPTQNLPGMKAAIEAMVRQVVTTTIEAQKMYGIVKVRVPPSPPKPEEKKEEIKVELPPPLPPPPVKPVERAPPRAAPPEFPPTPITVRAVPELELMKKEIEERIEEEKRRRLKRGPIAGEPAAGYLKEKSELPMEERLKVARAIAAAAPAEPAAGRFSVCPEIPGFIHCPTCKFKYSVWSVLNCPYRPEPTRFGEEGGVAQEKGKPPFPEQFRENDVMQVPGDYAKWGFGDFEGQIPGLDAEDLEILLEYTDVSDKLTKDESKTLREMIKERIRKVEKAGS